MRSTASPPEGQANCAVQTLSESLKCRLGIEAYPVRGNQLEWNAIITGPKDTIWEGGVLSLSLYFHEQPNQQPYVVFCTVPFHPNVDRDTGEVCVNFPLAGKEWDPNTVFSILLHTQFVLAHPILDNPVNVEAAEMLMNKPHIYRKVVEQCVKTSQKLKQTCLVTEGDTSQHLHRDRIVKRIPFEEYLQAWTKLATSKARTLMTNESLGQQVSTAQVLFENSGSRSLASIPLTEACSDSINDMMYGIVKAKPPRTEKRRHRLKQIQHMMKLYKLYSKADLWRDGLSAPPTSAQHPAADMESEVDMLVAWTHSLSLEHLDDY
ncbi:ubiquitin-conjugating enzyme E2 U-like [Engraulis encrasicolus]|uniref:ubiquitin-conjugating enzyme E2 U-like n=1 Tax=Engraulis encrasicolus TaxID=184585 RepID=UPI002FD49B9C